MLEIWTKEQEAKNLSHLFEGVSNKAAFAREFKVPGGASMLSQHCSGHRPMSLEAAIAYAKGFKCSIAQISPRLAVEVHEASNTELSDLKPQNSSAAPMFPSAAPTLADTLEQALEVVAAALSSVEEPERDAISRKLASLALAPDSPTLRASIGAQLVASASGKTKLTDVEAMIATLKAREDGQK